MDNSIIVKRIAYKIMAIFFYICYLFPINEKKILLIMTHDSSDEGNVGSTYHYFQNQDPDLIFKKVTRENYTFNVDKNLFKNLIYMFIAVPYHIATSHTIFMDNVFLPFSSITVKHNTRLVQLWHGTGTIKKFGLDCEEGWIKKLGKTTNENTSHFIVGSSYMKEIYKTAFGANEDKIFSIGCPRTDLFFDKSIIDERRQDFYKSYPELINKKLVLYAPTFRDYDNIPDDVDIHLDIDKFIENLDNNYVLGLRLHPHLAHTVNLEKNTNGPYQNRVYDFSDYTQLNTLLICCDSLITDYSSIIFEYALMKKPMIFYCYDLSKFEQSGRGFYSEYRSIIPGPIAFKTEDVVNSLMEDTNNQNIIDTFLDEYLENCDGHSRMRLYNLLMG
jgi:CDP-ribitol ribitolphosphotransferase / teichoic acid ribitol-phosphate polymerase